MTLICKTNRHFLVRLVRGNKQDLLGAQKTYFVFYSQERKGKNDCSVSSAKRRKKMFDIQGQEDITWRSERLLRGSIVSITGVIVSAISLTLQRTQHRPPLSLSYPRLHAEEGSYAPVGFGTGASNVRDREIVRRPRTVAGSNSRSECCAQTRVTERLPGNRLCNECGHGSSTGTLRTTTPTKMCYWS